MMKRFSCGVLCDNPMRFYRFWRGRSVWYDSFSNNQHCSVARWVRERALMPFTWFHYSQNFRIFNFQFLNHHYYVLTTILDFHQFSVNFVFSTLFTIVAANFYMLFLFVQAKNLFVTILNLRLKKEGWKKRGGMAHEIYSNKTIDTCHKARTPSPPQWITEPLSPVPTSKMT